MGVAPSVAIRTAFATTLMTATGAIAIDTNWHPPKATSINNLDTVLNSTGVYGFIFNSSETPAKLYGRYNWCNMPHVRKTEYVKAPKEYELEYVEVIHRHHKRTPYQSNTFPVESYPWNCDDASLFYYGNPNPGQDTALTYWKIYQSSLNPFSVSGFNGTCSFPQITNGGLADSWQHGRDLYEVYHDILHFLPSHLDHGSVSFRVTTNQITSQVAGMVISAMYGPGQSVPLLVQRDSVDSLEPAYSCSAADSLYSDAQNRPDSAWAAHLNRTQSLFNALDGISGVSPTASDWHVSYDHYFDNLSSRLCHKKPLPCNIGDPSKCITEAEANEVFRLGEFEYSYQYRDSTTSLDASVASYGVWIGELAQHFRDRISSMNTKMKYRHNVAHDGSLSRLLSILQVETMVWPGMGAEVVFELYKKQASKGEIKYFVRVLWGGQIMRSSNPDLGSLDMIPIETLLAYFDALVGQRGQKVPGLCEK
ncbi:Histidine acid phosphatase family protein [Paecilomyces variotii No. 5]|uniref:Histidine acid phosphatase family protein n=1 Tax=Byssochlamys spectabilis (strain No. 5 / NBRC 109023) TaxID=1356009 RepID=V5G4E1_BYSSN|nr:Histidine acid phosphatase family protein [Paecilomyces variotii No. 5]